MNRLLIIDYATCDFMRAFSFVCGYSFLCARPTSDSSLFAEKKGYDVIRLIYFLIVSLMSVLLSQTWATARP